MSWVGLAAARTPAAEDRLQAEGVSIRAISRMTGASKNTVVKLLADAGEAFSDYQDRTLRGLTCKRLQVDEIWAGCTFSPNFSLTS